MKKHRMMFGLGLAVMLQGVALQSQPMTAETLVDEGLIEEDAGWSEETPIRLPDNLGDSGVGAAGTNGDKGDGAYATNDAGDQDGGALIEDGSSQQKQEGALLDDILEAEQKAQEALEAAEDLMTFSVPLLESADVQRLQEYLEELYAEENPTGSNGELEIASYIKRTMSDWGYTVQEQNFHEGFLNENLIDVPGLNIIAERGANSEHRTSQILIVAAHYDSKTDPAEGDQLANDKTGAAVLLETARIISQVESDLDLCFVFLSGEEDGLYGSEKLVDFLTEEQRSRVSGVVYVGTVGTASDAPYLQGADDPEGNALGRTLRAVALGKELDMMFAEDVAETSDGLETSDASENAFSDGQEIYVDVQDAMGDDPDNGGDPAQSASGEERAADWSAAYASRGRGELLLQYPYTEATPDNWSFVTDLWSGRKHFAEAGLQTIYLFQDVTGLYVDGTDAVVRAPEQAGSQASVEENAEGEDAGTSADGGSDSLIEDEETVMTEYETAYAAPLFLAEMETDSELPLDMESMQRCIHILSETILQYMYAETARAAGVQ